MAARRKKGSRKSFSRKSSRSRRPSVRRTKLYYVGGYVA